MAVLALNYGLQIPSENKNGSIPWKLSRAAILTAFAVAIVKIKVNRT